MAIDRDTEAFRRTEDIQTAVSHPATSAWVSANAGSGKTHVLTNRVIRLLMGDPSAGQSGADPSSILCITYTKAAAAEMQGRLFRILGDWALIDDETLAAALNDRLGPDVPLPGLLEIRKLFARALDTPGGLRIQTIHSFCEGLLRRFPVEAGLLPGFAVLDDAEVMEIRAGIARNLARQIQGAPWEAALALLLDHYPDLDTVMSVVTDRDIASSAARAEEMTRRLGVDLGTDEEALKAEVVAGIDRAYLRALEEVHDEFVDEFGEKSSKYDRQSGLARRILAADKNELPALFDEAVNAWLKADGGMPSARTCNGNGFVRARVPSYPDDTYTLCERLVAAVEQIGALRIAELTSALFTVAEEVKRRYEAAKAARGVVDFDDLISHTAQFLERVPDAWVRYKLDKGISHLLLDEAQDTGAAQWSVIRRLRDEFWRQEEQHAPRTAFVVGDKKQSIYSFQGADARLFDEERSRMKAAAEGHRYEDRTLFLSFRSASSVLTSVDTFFEDEAGDGLYAEDRELHAAAKSRLKGQVELWPMVRRPDAPARDLWSLPVDAGGPAHPYRELSRAIARDIKAFVETGALDDGQGGARRPRYGDIMILCQRRTGIFHELVRTLSLENIPNGGTDRVKLMEDVAVRDVRSALRFAVNHNDDLSLAEVMTSPLGGFSDDDLYEVAHDRGEARLWPTLRARQGGDQIGILATALVERLDAVERVGRQHGAFAFLSTLLDEGSPPGRYLFRRRLGAASDDALDEVIGEALDFDTRHPRTLDGFLAHLEGLTSDIKKEFDAGADVVRIMTVHGAKGLEAPVVYLADAAYMGRVSAATVPLPGEEGEDGLVVCAPSGVKHPVLDEGKARLKARDLQEYRRKFYVAATRAEQRLVICGTQSGRLAARFSSPEDAAREAPPTEASWYGLALRAFERLEDKITTRPCPWRDDRELMVFGALPDETPATAGATAERAPSAVPDWLFTPAAPEHTRLVSFPSALDGEDDGPVLAPRGGGEGGAVSPRQRGLVIHELLQLLPALEPDARAKAAEAHVVRLAPDVAPDIREGWAREALAVMADPAFAGIFGPDARAEVPLRGRIGEQVYSGQVDRLLITPDEIFVVDYKTMRPPPEKAAETPPGILRQMAIYRTLLQKSFPGRTVRAAILWTFAPRLVPLGEELLSPALESLGHLPPCGDGDMA